ncbi:MAG: hypothetical protein R3C14_33250 [Caldilineaceae bacterium]
MFSISRVWIIILTVVNVITLATVALGQSSLFGLAQPFIVDVNQIVPVMAKVLVPLDEGTIITATVPLTVQVSLQIGIDGLAMPPIVTQMPPEVSVRDSIQLGEEKTDDLGHIYVISIDSPIVEITEWTNYISDNGRWKLSGEIHQLPNVPKIDDILATVYMYGATGELIEVTEILNVAFGLKPGGYNRFEVTFDSSSEHVSRYEVDMRILPPIQIEGMSSMDANSNIMGGLAWSVVSALNVGATYDEDDNFRAVESLSGELLAVTLNVENQASEPIEVIVGDYQGSIGLLRLVDVQNRQFAPVFGTYKSQCNYTKIAQPAIPLKCTIVFEVPDGNAEYALLLIDGSGNEAARIPVSRAKN